jgi:hypothetical protein
MSNHVMLTATTFINHAEGGTKTYGYRLYDDYGQTYNNTLEKIDDDLELLAAVVRDEPAGYMFDYMNENKRGLSINGTWYDYEEIEHLIGDKK